MLPPSPLVLVCLLSLPGLALAAEAVPVDRPHSLSSFLPGHAPPSAPLEVTTARGRVRISERAYHFAFGPSGRVAFVDEDGLSLWRDGRAVLVARAAPRGISRGVSGVAFCSPARRGFATGVSFMRWDGSVTSLVAADEDRPGPGGFHSPVLSADESFVVAFSDATPLPSVWRFDLRTGAASLVASAVPGLVGTASFRAGLLVWSTGDGVAALDVSTGELR